MGDEALARRQADQDLAVIAHADGRRRQEMAERVGNERRRAVTPKADEAVGGTEVDPDDHLTSRSGGKCIAVSARAALRDCGP
jgi:hypothetical protein